MILNANHQQIETTRLTFYIIELKSNYLYISGKLVISNYQNIEIVYFFVFILTSLVLQWLTFDLFIVISLLWLLALLNWQYFFIH